MCKWEQAQNIDMFTVLVNNDWTKPLSATIQIGDVRKQLWTDQLNASKLNSWLYSWLIRHNWNTKQYRKTHTIVC